MTDAGLRLLDMWPVEVSARALYMGVNSPATALDVSCPLCGDDRWVLVQPVSLATHWACPCEVTGTYRLVLELDVVATFHYAGQLPDPTSTVVLCWRVVRRSDNSEADGEGQWYDYIS